MKLKNKTNKGITLVALVITIIILLILTGVTIVQLTSNGLLTKAQQAAKESKYANAAEKVALAVNASYDTTGSLNDDYLKDNLNRIDGINEPVEKVEYDLKVVVDGFEFTISKYGKITGEKTEVATLPDNTTDTKAGIEVKLPEKWGTQAVSYIDTTDGTEVTTLETVSTVYAISVGNGETIPVPKGFVYVGGNLATGVIISDNINDKYKYNPKTQKDNDLDIDKTTHDYRKNLQGNQFVWIPCSLDKYNFVTTYATNTGANYGYERIPGEIAQIEKYGGFYVGRYEAGICMPTGTNNSGITTENILDGTRASSWQCSDFNTTTGKPVVQAGAIPWYHANHSTASNVAENMYKGNLYVTSGLMTGTMWDQMIEKIGDGNTTTSGNYNNSDYTSDIGIYHATAGSTGTGAWSTTSAQKTSGTCWLVESGMLDTYASYHIYDTAGNLWEWVEQVASESSSNVAFTLRGGSFLYGASARPASCRYFNRTSYTNTEYGFRVALYLK